MPHFDGARGRVYYRHWRAASPTGDSSRTGAPRATLVFLHGYGEHSGLYHRFANQLNARGIEVWVLDQYGHGLSDGDRGRIEELGDAVDAAQRLVVRATREHPETPVFLAGHSLGSVVAALTALAGPGRFRGLIVSGSALSPLPWLDDADPAPVELTLDALSADEFYRDELVNDPLAFTEGDLVALASRLFPPAWTVLAEDLPGLDLPILAVHGADDPVAPLDLLQDWRDRLGDLRIEVFDGAAHDVLNEVAHREVAAVIGDFIDAESAAKAAA